MFTPDKYLSVTWQMGGRVYPILDCYGLVHEVRHDLQLPAWPLFDGVINEGRQMNETFTHYRGHVRTCAPEEGAVAICYIGGLVSHLGVVVRLAGGLHVMEANPGRNVTLLSLVRFERQYARVEYYT